ncbi:MFS transporter [Luedemannella flava]|uniref:MFS transporter n=1 Tax=Luedemannella flava TaxID=349316 RepID=A0ABP4YWB8_9ACTN
MSALAEPTTPVRGRWVALLTLTNLAVWLGFFTPIQVLLPEQLAGIAPGGKETALAWVTGLGALAAVVVNPLAGALSDRTTGRFGRRHPWTLFGGLFGALGLVLLTLPRTVAGVAVGWIFVQVCLNAMLASLTAAVPDRVPVTQRGAVSGWIGIPQVLGVVLGTILVTVVVSGVTAGYLAAAIAVAVLTLPFPLFTADDPLARDERPPFSPRTFWISPRRHPDFAWAFGTRFLVQLGNALGTLYLLYFLTDAVGLADPDTGLLILILVYTGGLMATTVLAGRRSDRSGRRRSYVVTSGVVMTVAAVLLAVAPTWPVAVVAAAVLGGGYGIYLAVDAALITQVLPTATGRAKDLGIINIANSAPQVLAPALAGPIVTSLGGYPVLYGLTAVVTLLGGVFIYRVRSVA